MSDSFWSYRPLDTKDSLTKYPFVSLHDTDALASWIALCVELHHHNHPKVRKLPPFYHHKDINESDEVLIPNYTISFSITTNKLEIVTIPLLLKVILLLKVMKEGCYWNDECVDSVL